MGYLDKSIRPNCPVLYCNGRTVVIYLIELNKGLRMPSEEIAFTVWPKHILSAKSAQLFRFL